MARGNAEAKGAAQTGLTNAQASYGALMPELSAEAINPPGMNPADVAKATTAAEQTAGGVNAGAVGQGALLAGRTKNPGTAAAAIGQGARAASEGLSKNTLGIQLANQQLKEKQRAGAQSELGGLYGTSLSNVAPNVNANTQSENASWNWAKDLFVPLMTAAEKGASGGLAG